MNGGLSSLFCIPQCRRKLETIYFAPEIWDTDVVGNYLALSVSLTLRVSQVPSLAFYSQEVELAIEGNLATSVLLDCMTAHPTPAQYSCNHPRSMLEWDWDSFFIANMQDAFSKPSKMSTPVKRTILSRDNQIQRRLSMRWIGQVVCTSSRKKEIVTLVNLISRAHSSTWIALLMPKNRKPLQILPWTRLQNDYRTA